MLRLNQTMMEHGSEGESFPTIALAGSATSMPHGVPSAQRIIQDGDFVLMDYGAMVERLSQRHDPYRLRGTAQRKDAAGL